MNVDKALKFWDYLDWRGTCINPEQLVSLMCLYHTYKPTTYESITMEDLYFEVLENYVEGLETGFPITEEKIIKALENYKIDL